MGSFNITLNPIYNSYNCSHISSNTINVNLLYFKNLAIVSVIVSATINVSTNQF